MAGKIVDFLSNVEKQIASKQVKVGFINGAAYPDGTKVATVAAANEYGNPANNQPPRPFFRHAISEHQEAWKSDLVKGLRAGHSSKTVLEVVGSRIAGDVFESIATLMEPELKASTLRARRTRKDRPNKSTKPLVDTGVMQQNVTYEVGEIESTSDS